MCYILSIRGLISTLALRFEGRLTNVIENSNQAAAYVYDGDGKMVKKQEYENGQPSAARTIYIGNLLELQLPSNNPNMTPTATLRTATPPTRTPLPSLTASLTLSSTSTVTATSTLTSTVATRTSTSTFTSTYTYTSTASKTPGPSPTRTQTPSKTLTPSKTSTKPTRTSTSATKTKTPITPTQTPTTTPSPTFVPVTLTGPIWRYYYYAGSARIAMRVKDDDDNLVFYLFTDHLSSTNVVTDPVGGMVSLNLYKPCPFWVLREGESRTDAGTTLTD